MDAKRRELDELRKKLDTCNARKCFQDKLAIPDIPPEDGAFDEPCAACRDIASQYEYVKAKVERMRILRNLLRAAAQEASLAAGSATGHMINLVHAARQDPGDASKDKAAQDAKKEADILKQRAEQLHAQVEAVWQAYSMAINLLRRLDTELANCRKKNCPPQTSQVSTPPPEREVYEPPLRPCPRCQDEAERLRELEHDLRIKQRVRLALQTTIDIYGKDIDKGTLSPVNQIAVNDAVDRLPEVDKQIAELEAKVKEQKEAMTKCTEKFCSTARTSQKKKDKATHENRTPEGQGQDRRIEDHRHRDQCTANPADHSTAARGRAS
jgi:hypothetical protein